MRMKAVATDLVAATLGASGAYLTLVLVWPPLTGPTAFFVAMAFAAGCALVRQLARATSDDEPAGGWMEPMFRSNAGRLARSQTGAITIGVLLLKLLLAVVLSGVVLGVLVPWLQTRGTEFSSTTVWIVLAAILVVLFLPDLRRGPRRRD